MSKRFNNVRLLFFLGGLTVILLLTIIVKIPKENASLKTRIFELDTLQITGIILYPKSDDKLPVEFKRQGSEWIVQQGDITSATRDGAVLNMFVEAVNLKPKSLATKDEAKWEEYELTDSLGTRVKFMNNKEKVLVDLLIGKFT